MSTQVAYIVVNGFAIFVIWYIPTLIAAVVVSPKWFVRTPYSVLKILGWPVTLPVMALCRLLRAAKWLQRQWSKLEKPSEVALLSYIGNAVFLAGLTCLLIAGSYAFSYVENNSGQDVAHLIAFGVCLPTSLYILSIRNKILNRHLEAVMRTIPKHKKHISALLEAEHLTQQEVEQLVQIIEKHKPQPYR